MNVILLREVKGLGRSGEIKEVSDGYARNFLLARGLAQEANKHALRILNDQQEKKRRFAIKHKKERQNLAKKINRHNFLIKVKTDDSGTLYAGLNAEKIADVLNQENIHIEAADIKLSKNIKQIGEYEVGLELGSKKISIKLNIVN
jgi:large subunit ribosomal protein L9